MAAAPQHTINPPDNPDSQITPRIIPRSEHSVSRENIDREALKVLYRLRDAGHAAYLVGGGVRDLLLGKKPKDFDISTDARPGQLKKLFRNSRLIGKRFRLVQVYFHGGKIIEVSTFRCRGEYDIDNASSDEVLAANNTYGTSADDAFRRDLTINALFYEIQNFTVIDYTGGVADLEKGLIRIIGDAERRIIRDPVRMMRAIRHAARNNFRIEEKTFAAIRQHRLKLSLCPVSRIRDELFRDLRSGTSSAWMDLVVESGLVEVLLPVYAGEEQRVLQDECAAILKVVDRLLDHGIVFTDHLLVALLLYPWAEKTLDLTSLPANERRGLRFSGAVRGALDEALNHLSIKRSIKETVTLLYVNMHHFEETADREEKKSWPRWLTGKSYFNECLLVFSILQEAKGRKSVDEKMLKPLEVPPREHRPIERPDRKRGGRRRKSRGAVISSKNDGGIFGLKP